MIFFLLLLFLEAWAAAVQLYGGLLECPNWRTTGKGGIRGRARREAAGSLRVELSPLPLRTSSSNHQSVAGMTSLQTRCRDGARIHYGGATSLAKEGAL